MNSIIIPQIVAESPAAYSVGYSYIVESKVVAEVVVDSSVLGFLANFLNKSINDIKNAREETHKLNIFQQK